MDSSIVSEPLARPDGLASDRPAASKNGTPRPPRRLRIASFVAFGLAVAVAVVATVLVLAHMHPAGGIEASGTIEATESDLAPKVQGRLVDLRVHDGDPVKRGQVLATLERLEPTLGLDQARANVAAARAQVGVAQAAYDLQRQTYETTLAQAQSGLGIAGSRLGQAGENLGIETRAATLAIDQAQAQLASARASYDHARIDLARAESLVGTGDEPRQSLDDATAGYRTAAAQLQAAHDAVALAQANERSVEVRRLDVDASRLQQRQSAAGLRDAQAQRELVTQRRAQLLAAGSALAQTRAALGLAQDQVRETELIAPFDGYVVSHNFEDGELIQPGSAVLTIGDLAHPYLYVYVSETDLPRIKAGMRADATIDGVPGRTYTGTVTEISNTAEFTPENVQTKEQRIEYLVFRVKIQFTDTTGTLKPGLPADAIIHANPA